MNIVYEHIRLAAALEPEADVYEELRYKRHKNTLYLFGADQMNDYPYVFDIGRDFHNGAKRYARLAYDFLPVDRYVGHSLGGMAAQWLSIITRKPAISIGSPPVYATKGVAKNHIRVVHRADPYRKILPLHHRSEVTLKLGSSWWEWFTNHPTHFHRLSTYEKCFTRAYRVD